MNKDIVFPDWLDNLIYYDFGGIYEPSPEAVESNPDKDYDFAKLYLGTYFPRSYAEAYCIVGTLLENEKYRSSLLERTELSVFDFCCGTGGEILGLISILQDNLPNLKRINIDAFDANADYVRFLFHINEKIRFIDEVKVEVNINSQGIFVEEEQHLVDIKNYTNRLYDFVISFKALNEFIKHDVFPNENVYQKVANCYLPILAKEGVMIITDLSHKSKEKGFFYPVKLNEGINLLLSSNNDYKSIYPYSCYNYAPNCAGCYSQDIVYVTHSRHDRDVSKFAYRIIGRTDFANKVAGGIKPSICRVSNHNADKNSPYK